MRGEEAITWTLEAQARLEQVPEGMMRELTRQRVERLAQQRGLTMVTPEVIEDKYQEWAKGSARAPSEMTWADDALERMARVPPFVRGMVIKATEAYAQRQGLTEITSVVVEEAKAFWEETGRFHHP